MEQSRPPSWYQDRIADWAEDYYDEAPVVRLRAVYRLEGHRHWIVVAEIQSGLSPELELFI
ncbi:hypothetical protein ACIF6L_07480 [Kitasatospora sp. NPDC086009]|uniref:hypothetical protein n=1 Tax=unclassified Kitasatospora TaxID=2633591 RepID=UPI0037C5FFDD